MLQLELVLGLVVLSIGHIGPELQLLEQAVGGVEGVAQLVVTQGGTTLTLRVPN